jgi:hypothetical protein
LTKKENELIKLQNTQNGELEEMRNQIKLLENQNIEKSNKNIILNNLIEERKRDSKQLNEL